MLCSARNAMFPRSETIYFKEIGRYKLLTDEEERCVVKEVQEEKEGAVNHLITSNLRFVVSIARRYRGRGLSYLELINEGNLGLLKAAKRFDFDANVKFISYAVWWIRQSIQKALFEQPGTVRIPANKIGLLYRFKKMLEKNKGDYDATIALPEFKEYEQEILDVMDKMRGLSLDAPISSHGPSGDDDGVRSLQDIIGEKPNQEEDSERGELARVIDAVLQNVTSREERILRMFFGLNFSKQFTLDEIGKELNLTRERVRLIRDRSLRKLFRNPASRAKLMLFLDNPPNRLVL
jgi:RNA polymerase primary sigma factor